MLADPPTQTLMDNWTGGVQWLPDSSGFFFSAITGAAVDFAQSVYLHQRYPTPTTVPADVAWTGAQDYRMVVVSRDGRYAVALERLQNPIPVAVAALGKSSLQWRPFVTSSVGTVAGYIVGERYVAVTDIGAPRGRVVAIALHADDPNDPLCWQELVAESDAALRTVTLVGNALYLTEFVDTYTRIRIVDLRGNELGIVPLPSRGSINEPPFPMMSLVPKGHPEKFLFGFSSLTVSPAIYSHTPGQEGIETLQQPAAWLENTLVEDRWAVSADGTRIPYHVVRRADVNASQIQPTLIYAYGGYNYPLMPQFPGPMAAFIAVGGVFVHAHLRGGAELGLEWWQGGRMDHKQNGYDDLYAIAEDLIAAKICTSRSLGVTGASNGGLMVGVAVTQRPDLWAVAVARVPVLDLIGACREPYGRQAIAEEMANVEDPQEVNRLATFSPYQLVRDGVSYPALFIDAGDTDPRCPPWHARKFAARMQAATSGSAPILLHVWENVGHGWATDKSIAVTEHTEWLAFALRHLGA
jgi:prolyl oligopeptidase